MGNRRTPPAGIVRFPQIAQPNLEQVLEQFLDDQARGLKPRTLARYRNVVQLLQHYLDGYGYQPLGKEESKFFDHHFEATGSNQRSFCQLFGADKITENLGGFLGYFMIRKVVAGEEVAVTNLTRGVPIRAEPLSETALELLEAGGIVALLRERGGLRTP